MLFTLTAINQNGTKAFFPIEYMYTKSGFFSYSNSTNKKIWKEIKFEAIAKYNCLILRFLATLFKKKNY